MTFLFGENMHWSRLEEHLRTFILDEPRKPLIILAPFITTDYLSDLLSEHQEVHIVTSWRKDHLLSGVSNLALYDEVRKRDGWTLYINDRLHAKVYCKNFETVMIGSANLTRTAMSDGVDSNIELLVNESCDVEMEHEIRNVLRTSLHLNDELFEIYHRWYHSVEQNASAVDTGSVILPNPDREMFLVSQLPATASPERLWNLISGKEAPDTSWSEQHAVKHDMANYGLRQHLGYKEFLSILIEMMKSQTFFCTFTEEIDSEGLRFGAAKQWIHERCIDDPVPYRKELTRTVQNLFAWVVALYPDEFEIIQPRHSQIIRRIAR